MWTWPRCGNNSASNGKEIAPFLARTRRLPPRVKPSRAAQRCTAPSRMLQRGHLRFSQAALNVLLGLAEARAAPTLRFLHKSVGILYRKKRRGCLQDGFSI